jgi:tRNA threonylcarbamoyladenosine modification (KEOPS) complex Cgi121 subunit
LLKRIDEFGKWVLITGFSNVKIDDIDGFLGTVRRAKPPNLEVQFFGANRIASWQHLYFAVLNALTAFSRNRNISNTLAVETMLYASAQHQIKKATQILGIKRGLGDMAVTAISDSTEKAESTLAFVARHLDAKPDDSVLKISRTKLKTIRKVFGISDAEIKVATKEDDPENATVDLVIERMALLAAHR